MRKTRNPAPDEPKPATMDTAPQQASVLGPRRLNLDVSLVPPTGRKLDLTNEQIYELIEFP
jgi:hypothetical protein